MKYKIISDKTLFESNTKKEAEAEFVRLANGDELPSGTLLQLYCGRDIISEALSRDSTDLKVSELTLIIRKIKREAQFSDKDFLAEAAVRGVLRVASWDLQRLAHKKGYSEVFQSVLARFGVEEEAFLSMESADCRLNVQRLWAEVQEKIQDAYRASLRTVLRSQSATSTSSISNAIDDAVRDGKIYAVEELGNILETM
jgi:hypothetical protein